MKNKGVIIFFISIVFWSCTKYSETELTPVKKQSELTPENTTTNLPVINLKVKPYEFDSMHIRFREEIEISAFISFIRSGEFKLANTLCEIKIKGSVSAESPLKSLGIKFDKTQDNTSGDILNVNHILDIHDLRKLKAIRLRNSGNDFSFTMMKQLCYLELVKQFELDLDINYIEPALVFVNDEFHGLMNINSEVNANGLSRLYNINKSTITLAKSTNPDQIKLKDGNEEDLEIFLNKIEEKDAGYFLEHLDIKSTIDYILFESMMGNWDWPYNNVRFYKINDSKWRFALFDLDNLNTQFLNKSRLGFIESTTPNRISNLFLLLLENEEFKLLYDKRYDEMISSTVFSPDNFNLIVDSNMEVIEDLMPYQIQKHSSPATLTEWYLNVESLKSNYLKRHRFLTKKNKQGE